MGLQSALSTALTGMTGAETTIDVVGNNVANANTVGFKESSVQFATQFLQTQSIGSAPTANRGGTNPRQTGLGVKVAEITPDFTQGTVEISSNPLDLALQGDGFFIVEGSQGEHLYTRNGQFKTNADNEIVTITGQRVLGYSVDANFQIQPTGLSPIQIPLGAAAVAQATENVVLKGALNPNSAVGTIPEIIESGVLSDGSQEFPSGVPTTSALATPAADSVVLSAGAPGAAIPPGTYNYRISYVDSDGNEGPASNIADVAVGSGLASIGLSNIPQPADPAFQTIRVYRQDPADSEYRQVGALDISGGPVTTFADSMTDATLNAQPTLNDDTLGNNSYSYYVTFYNSLSGAESRPTARIGPVTADSVNQPRIRLDDIPTPAVGSEYDSVRIYRNLATSPNSYHLVSTIAPGASYIDNSPDSVISVATNPTVNLDGPAIEFGTRLVDVVSRDGADYNHLFGLGQLNFSGDKGGRQLAERTLDVTATTTVQDLLSFMDESMGVVKAASEDTFPTGESYGGTITDESKLQFTSNMGIENALSIDLSAFTFTPAGGAAETVPLQFNSTQVANGEGASADFQVFDSLGTPLNVRVTTVLEQIDSTGARFRWIATSPQNDPDTGFATTVGTGVITTDGKGKFISATDDRVAIDRGDSPASTPLEFKLDFAQVTGLASDDVTDNSLSAASQDGFPAGTLSSFIITETGRIQGVFSNGSSRDLGQLRMARFANNAGLQQVGDNMFAVGVNSGLPIEGDPGSQGAGSITTGAVELSNTDIGQNLIDLILASTQYRGGARVITTVQQLFDELLALRR